MNESPYEAPKEANLEPPLEKRTKFNMGWPLLVICILLLAIGLILPATRSARPAAYRMQCSNNLRQISLALHNYEARFLSLPPAYTVDSEGQPLHSWRTLILPFLEHKRLYDTIDLSKPWDDPANTDARNTEVSVFRCPTMDSVSTGTTYKAIVSADACFHATNGRRFSEITDGLNQTLMLIEDSPQSAVHWMAPLDVDAQFVLGFGKDTKFSHIQGTNALFADGSIRFLTSELAQNVRRSIITISGNDDVSDEPMFDTDK